MAYASPGQLCLRYHFLFVAASIRPRHSWPCMHSNEQKTSHGVCADKHYGLRAGKFRFKCVQGEAICLRVPGWPCAFRSPATPAPLFGCMHGPEPKNHRPPEVKSDQQHLPEHAIEGARASTYRYTTPSFEERTDHVLDTKCRYFTK